ncbi:hypothetical protein PR048_020242 [Dryococelus australis]|uniref:Endonuclease/exonuclease/phosphatase domain-containing protein n=1 Tax=Dryococelus australis TaxID=614101 RepID=A0ABQ9H5R3_9NEOP|nr:hypothetical protein PR048_020242 [Dryococelus australis]
MFLGSLHSKNVIFAADVNAKSRLWFSSETDKKGILVEQFIAASNLCICNTARYVSPAQRTEIFIDDTFASTRASIKATSIEVLEDSSNDHGLILNEITMEDIPEHVVVDVRPWYTHMGANWKRVDNLLKVETKVLIEIEFRKRGRRR